MRGASTKRTPNRRCDRWARFAPTTAPPASSLQRRRQVLWTIAIVLLILWLLGLVTSYTMGGFIHVLFVIAVIVILIRIIQGRKVL
jgi:hypothetical protein